MTVAHVDQLNLFAPDREGRTILEAGVEDQVFRFIKPIDHRRIASFQIP